MTVNRTTLLDLPIITTGTESGAWGNITNNGLSQYMDIAIAGMTSLTSANFTAGALTIANTQGDSSATNIAAGSAQYATIKVSSLAANSTITAPSSNRAYRIINADGTYTLTIKASGQTGVTFPINTSGIVVFNGTDYVLLGSYVIASAGTASLPSITTTGDTNTGIYFPAADTIAFAEGGVESARFDSAGNFGLGVTPATWSIPALQLKNCSLSGGAPDTYLSSNANFTSGVWKYIASTNATQFYQNAAGGEFVWRTAASGTAGNTITFTQAMTLDASGNLGLGATSITAISSGYATAHIGGANGGGVKLGTSSTSHGYVAGSATNIELGATSNIFLSFFTNNAERARITSGGNFLINNTYTTSSKLIVAGSGTSNAAYAGIFCDSGGANILSLRNDGYIDTGTRAVSPYNNTTGSAANMYVDSAGGLYRSTSSLKYKTDVQDATHGLAEVMQLRSVTYKGKNDGDTVFGGLIAEEVHAAGLTEFVQYAPDGSPDALAYGNMVSLCIKAIQEQQALIASLTARVALLEGN